MPDTPPDNPMNYQSENATGTSSSSEGRRLRELWNDYLPVWLSTPMVLVMLLITIFPGAYDLYLSFVHYKYTNRAQMGHFAGLSELPGSLR